MNSTNTDMALGFFRSDKQQSLVATALRRCRHPSVDLVRWQQSDMMSAPEALRRITLAAGAFDAARSRGTRNRMALGRDLLYRKLEMDRLRVGVTEEGRVDLGGRVYSLFFRNRFT